MVKRVIQGKDFGSGSVKLVFIRNVSWRMAKVASQILEKRSGKDIVVTKYGHVTGKIPSAVCLERGHPVQDENSFRETRTVLANYSRVTSKTVGPG